MRSVMVHTTNNSFIMSETNKINDTHVNKISETIKIYTENYVFDINISSCIQINN